MARSDRRKGSGNRGSRRDSGDASPMRDYKSRDFRGSGKRGNRRGSGDRDSRMHQVVCDECGQSCEVPFQPTQGKPIFCSDCFREKDKGSSGRGSSKELEEINHKLDKIMRALEIN